MKPRTTNICIKIFNPKRALFSHFADNNVNVTQFEGRKKQTDLDEDNPKPHNNWRGMGLGSACFSSDQVSYEDFHASSLSISPGSQSSSGIASFQIPTEYVAANAEKNGNNVNNKKSVAHRKSVHTFGQRTSHYRRVTSFEL